MQPHTPLFKTRTLSHLYIKPSLSPCYTHFFLYCFPRYFVFTLLLISVLLVTLVLQHKNQRDIGLFLLSLPHPSGAVKVHYLLKTAGKGRGPIRRKILGSSFKNTLPQICLLLHCSEFLFQ